LISLKDNQFIVSFASKVNRKQDDHAFVYIKFFTILTCTWKQRDHESWSFQLTSR